MPSASSTVVTTEVSGGVDGWSGRSQTLFGRHQWPVTLRHGPVVLAPIRIRDRAAWDRVRTANAAWLRPWEATLPPESEAGPSTFAGLVRTLTKQAKAGRTLPWLVHQNYILDRKMFRPGPAAFEGLEFTRAPAKAAAS